MPWNARWVTTDYFRFALTFKPLNLVCAPRAFPPRFLLVQDFSRSHDAARGVVFRLGRPWQAWGCMPGVPAHSSAGGSSFAVSIGRRQDCFIRNFKSCPACRASPSLADAICFQFYCCARASWRDVGTPLAPMRRARLPLSVLERHSFVTNRSWRASCPRLVVFRQAHGSLRAGSIGSNSFKSAHRIRPVATRGHAGGRSDIEHARIFTWVEEALRPSMLNPPKMSDPAPACVNMSIRYIPLQVFANPCLRSFNRGAQPVFETVFFVYVVVHTHHSGAPQQHSAAAMYVCSSAAYRAGSFRLRGMPRGHRGLNGHLACRVCLYIHVL